MYVPVGFPCDSAGKESACNMRDLASILGWKDPLEMGKEMSTEIGTLDRSQISLRLLKHATKFGFYPH